jgi:hypothetical protein
MPLVTVAVTTVLLAGAGPASAQTATPPEHASLAAAAAAAAQATPLEAPPAKKGKNPVIIGAIAGAVTATVLTVMAAKQYGENEAGGMCGACLAYWGPITIPAGAGIGAGIGWIVKATSPPPQPTGFPSSGWRQESAITIRF